MENNKYLMQRRARIKQWLRVRLGILQMLHKPFLNILLLPIIVFTVVLWKVKDKLFTLFGIPEVLMPIFKYTIISIVILFPIFVGLFLIETIGNITARKDEGDLEEAFNEQDLSNGCPILMNKKQIKGTNVTMREFYSSIPLRRWIEKKENLGDSMNVHFVENIKYGGKSNGRRIVIYTAPGREVTARGDLYDV